jgi:hypothetical protein
MWIYIDDFSCNRVDLFIANHGCEFVCRKISNVFGLANYIIYYRVCLAHVLFKQDWQRGDRLYQSRLLGSQAVK